MIYLFVVQYCSLHHYVTCIILNALLNLVKHQIDLKGKGNREIRKLQVLQRRVKCKISLQFGCLPSRIRFYVKTVKLKLFLEFKEYFKFTGNVYTGLAF